MWLLGPRWPSQASGARTARRVTPATPGREICHECPRHFLVGVAPVRAHVRGGSALSGEPELMCSEGIRLPSCSEVRGRLQPFRHRMSLPLPRVTRP